MTDNVVGLKGAAVATSEINRRFAQKLRVLADQVEVCVHPMRIGAVLIDWANARRESQFAFSRCVVTEHMRPYDIHAQTVVLLARIQQDLLGDRTLINLPVPDPTFFDD